MENNGQLSLNLGASLDKNLEQANDSVEKRVQFLKDEINKSNHSYYVDENPYLSDFEYDKLFAELKALEAEYPSLKTPDM